MAKTNSERQKAYRLRSNDRNNGDGDHRLNSWITSTADFALDRLARRYAVTRRQILERLIIEADSAILKGMAYDSPELENYLSRGVTV